MSKEELEILKNSIEVFISINSFLSASLDLQLAFFFLSDSNESTYLERVFFEIDADPQFENIKPFSNITQHSYFFNEEEILFMIGSIFQLIHIDQNHNGIWTIQMKLCSGNDLQLKSLFEHTKSEYFNEENSLFSFGDVLSKMDKLNDAEKSYVRLLKQLSSNYKQLAPCYQSPGIVNTDKNDLDSSLIWLNKSLEFKMQILKSDDPEIAEIYNRIGKVYRKKEELDRAIKLFEQALEIWINSLGDNATEVARCYKNIENTYQRKEKYIEALKYY